MFKKLKIVLALLGLGTLVGGLAACASNKDPIPDLVKEGNKVQITYDPGVGKFVNLDNVKVVDLYNPDKFEKDEDGKVNIKLTDPRSDVRPQRLTVTKQGHSFTGWYQNREMRVNDDGDPVNADGVALAEGASGYIIKSTVNSDEPVASEPAYDYSDPWNFETDRVTYSEADGDHKKITLYAGWVPYFRFEYYFKIDGKWIKSEDYTAYDYINTNAENSATYDRDTIFIPKWNDVTVQYKSSYNDGTEFDFPKYDGTTFKKAYKDEACTQEITDTLEHGGSVNFETSTAINPVQNVYVEVEQGERYKISTAKQLADNVNLSGWYEISADLDFKDVDWPTAFTAGDFGGRMYSASGSVSIKNVNVALDLIDREYIGLFGHILKEAQFNSVQFIDPKLNVLKLSHTTENTNLQTKIGLFAGYIEEGAAFTSTVLDGGMLTLTEIAVRTKPQINLIASGVRGGLNVSNKVTLRMQNYNKDSRGNYCFSMRINDVTLSQNGDVDFVLATYRDKTVEFKDLFIQF